MTTTATKESIFQPLVNPDGFLNDSFVTLCQTIHENDENAKNTPLPESSNDIAGYNKWCQSHMLRPSNMDHEDLFTLENKAYHDKLTPLLTDLHLMQ